MSFPRRNLNNLKGATGQTFFQHFVNNKLKCIYHPINQENDFGIDGYIELVVNECVTGKLIGVQLKHGNTFFETKTSSGFKFIGENKHLNYYLNSQSPVFIIIMDEDFVRMYWTEFDIGKTSPIGSDKWWIEISKENELNRNFQDKIFEAAGPIINFEEQIQINWSIDTAIKDSKFTVIAIPKSEIVTGSFDYITNFINRLSKNKEMLINSRSKLDIFFPEYYNDSREIFQIPEIMEWLRNSIEVGIPWFYFLNCQGKSAGMHLLALSYCAPINTKKEEKGYLVEFTGIVLGRFMEQNFINMNVYIEKNKISLKINKEISTGIFEYF